MHTIVGVMTAIVLGELLSELGNAFFELFFAKKYLGNVLVHVRFLQYLKIVKWFPSQHDGAVARRNDFDVLADRTADRP